MFFYIKFAFKSDEEVKNNFLDYRRKIKKKQSEYSEAKEYKTEAGKEKILKELAGLKADFINWYTIYDRGELVDHPILESEKLTIEEWEAYKRERLEDVDEFWKKKEERDLEDLRDHYMVEEKKEEDNIDLPTPVHTPRVI